MILLCLGSLLPDNIDACLHQSLDTLDGILDRSFPGGKSHAGTKALALIFSGEMLNSVIVQKLLGYVHTRSGHAAGSGESWAAPSIVHLVRLNQLISWQCINESMGETIHTSFQHVHGLAKTHGVCDNLKASFMGCLDNGSLEVLAWQWEVPPQSYPRLMEELDIVRALLYAAVNIRGCLFSRLQFDPGL